ncbi:MAG: 30S ribosomal protein S20 [Candidatus Lloydbacteria bacterium]|nr:30S ribosomal protein S20 [Candidatus Lloydbacteria bacterium]
MKSYTPMVHELKPEDKTNGGVALSRFFWYNIATKYSLLMPITASAKKALRSSFRKKAFNDRRKSAMKEEIKKFGKLIDAKNKKEAESLLPRLYKAIDKAAKRGVIKKNTAARKKSRIAYCISKLS